MVLVLTLLKTRRPNILEDAVRHFFGTTLAKICLIHAIFLVMASWARPRPLTKVRRT